MLDEVSAQFIYKNALPADKEEVKKVIVKNISDKINKI